MLVNQHNVVDDVFTLASGDQGVLNQTLVQDTSAFAVDPETLLNQHNVADEVFTLVSGDQGVLKQTSVQDTSSLAVDPDTVVSQHNVADEVFTLFFWGSRGSETNVSSRHVSTCCRPRHFDEPE